MPVGGRDKGGGAWTRSTLRRPLSIKSDRQGLLRATGCPWYDWARYLAIGHPRWRPDPATSGLGGAKGVGAADPEPACGGRVDGEPSSAVLGHEPECPLVGGA